MEIKRLEGIIEAILFTMGESVEVERIANAIEHDVPTTRKIIRNMRKRTEESVLLSWRILSRCVRNRKFTNI